uniref:Protein WVD2-like 1 isoform X1 n=1 Tax=Rhizophora mucronata TaxID=61149 RepID=A0A2P2K7E8_RHIMU
MLLPEYLRIRLKKRNMRRNALLKTLLKTPVKFMMCWVSKAQILVLIYPSKKTANLALRSQVMIKIQVLQYQNLVV